MSYVILGARGQLGFAFQQKLAGAAVALTRAQADLTEPEKLRVCLEKLRPSTVINCAAYNHVDPAEQHPLPALAVNGWGVSNLARICARLDCVLIHFSTDYVFGRDQDRHTPYTEDDAPGPVNVYGHSKLAGEFAVAALCPRHFLIRTSGLYGPGGLGGKGGNFVDTVLALARANQPIRVVRNQLSCPTFTLDLVEATLALVATGRFGLYHLTNAGPCNWLEFATRVFSLAGVQANLEAVTSADLSRPAQRPRYSVLANNRYQELGLPPLRQVQAALASYVQR